MHEFKDMEVLESALNNGAFITSKENTMIASWGAVGVIWGKKVYMVPIRESRYTKQFVDSTKEFTVSIPKKGEMKEAIAFCGRKSGRDYDKWKECNLEKVKAKSVDTYVVGGCEKYYECKVIYSIELDKLPKEIFNAWYTTPDNHTLYIGEIVEEY